MQSKHETRLMKLEKATNAAQATNHLAQVVIYNPVTGEPVTPIDERAIKYIWIPDNQRGDRQIMR